MNWTVFIPSLWPIPLLMALSYVTNLKEHGLRTTRTICSIIYLVGSAIGVFDYIVYSKMSGTFNLLMLHWLVWKSFFVIFVTASTFLIYKFFQLIYRHYIQARQETEK